MILSCLWWHFLIYIYFSPSNCWSASRHMTTLLVTVIPYSVLWLIFAASSRVPPTNKTFYIQVFSSDKTTPLQKQVLMISTMILGLLLDDRHAKKLMGARGPEQLLAEESHSQNLPKSWTQVGKTGDTLRLKNYNLFPVFNHNQIAVQFYLTKL